MCLHASDEEYVIPAETVRVARSSLPKGNVYLRMRDELGVWYHDRDFADLFSRRGQPAEAPWRLALVTIMQFAEGLTDRQAAEAVATRIDWKYVLGLELTAPSFDYSILSEFRDRLLDGQVAQQCWRPCCAGSANWACSVGGAASAAIRRMSWRRCGC